MVYLVRCIHSECTACIQSYGLCRPSCSLAQCMLKKCPPAGIASQNIFCHLYETILSLWADQSAACLYVVIFPTLDHILCFDFWPLNINCCEGLYSVLFLFITLCSSRVNFPCKATMQGLPDVGKIFDVCVYMFEEGLGNVDAS